MRKRKQNTTEYTPAWDTGTYQTGATRPPKGSSGLVAVLLVAVIFLGGVASMMGIINIRLLSEMSANPDPIAKRGDSTPNTTNSAGILGENDDPVPSIPADRTVQLNMSASLSEYEKETLYEKNMAALATVYSLTYCSEILSGTGIVITSDGYILTNAHVIESAQRIFVYLSDGRLLRAALVGSDTFTDLAVLYVDADGLNAAAFADISTVQAEQTVYALMTQPDANDPHLATCTVRQPERALTTGSLCLHVLETDISGSGGPVFNENGQIIGIQAGKIAQYFDKNACCDMGIVISASSVQALLGQLSQSGHIAGRPDLGIKVEEISKLYQHYWDLPGGLLVTDISKNSTAAAQGLEVGDILLTLDGEALSTRTDLYTVLYSQNTGDTVIAAVSRDGRQFTVTLTVQ